MRLFINISFSAFNKLKYTMGGIPVVPDANVIYNIDIALTF